MNFFIYLIMFFSILCFVISKIKLTTCSLLLFQCDVPEGALVPKSLYKEEFFDRSPDEPPLHMGNSLYLTAFIIKDYPNEVGFTWLSDYDGV